MAKAGIANPSKASEVGSGTDAAVTVALIDDTPPFVVGAFKLSRPGVLRSAETMVKTNPSNVWDSGELNSIFALLVVAEIAPDIMPVNVIKSLVSVFVTVRVNVSLTDVGVLGSAGDAVVNVPRLMLFNGGTVAVETNDV